jgi:membrane associated rhomboid family serine protease
MNNHRVRNMIPPLYAVLIIVGFIISTTVGIIVLIVGGMLTGVLWSALSGGPSHRDRSARAARRADRG